MNPQVVRPESSISNLIPGEHSADPTRALIMGILNVTPDSFFDGGRYTSLDDAVMHAGRMVESGVDIIDVGGESSRPGASSASLQEELDRVIPVIERLHSALDIPLSIDTVKPGVMKEAIKKGAVFINDINSLQSEGAIDVVADSGVPVCIMHMRGTPSTMQVNPEYGDVLSEVSRFLGARAAACVDAGIRPENIVVDPGFGFGKRISHNLELLNGIDRLCQLGYPVLAGLSRKSMIRRIIPDPVAGLHASVAMAVMAYMGGARILRVHDVAPTVEALIMARAVLRAKADYE